MKLVVAVDCDDRLGDPEQREEFVRQLQEVIDRINGGASSGKLFGQPRAVAGSFDIVDSNTRVELTSTWWSERWHRGCHPLWQHVKMVGQAGAGPAAHSTRGESR